MSDTPRTDARVKRMIDNNHSPEGLEYFARDLERELAAANERIKRLEAAGDALNVALKWHTKHHSASARWSEVMESKP